MQLRFNQNLLLKGENLRPDIELVAFALLVGAFETYHMLEILGHSLDLDLQRVRGLVGHAGTPWPVGDHLYQLEAVDHPNLVKAVLETRYFGHVRGVSKQKNQKYGQVGTLGRLLNIAALLGQCRVNGELASNKNEPVQKYKPKFLLE